MTEQPKQTLNEAQDNAPAAAEAEPVDTRPVDPTTGRPLAPAQPAVKLTQAPGEEDGPKGPEPTRYGDWERKGIVSDCCGGFRADPGPFHPPPRHRPLARQPPPPTLLPLFSVLFFLL